ncbi:hypothetical protein COO60DRAFT_579681 [Scenedesmus sp. NREL 46B-D3]|nr:hypothetical protein COO60DRAFT_579681 [Scenedesmus sp. NREL 46B-D3]
MLDQETPTLVLLVLRVGCHAGAHSCSKASTSKHTCSAENCRAEVSTSAQAGRCSTIFHHLRQETGMACCRAGHKGTMLLWLRCENKCRVLNGTVLCGFTAGVWPCDYGVLSVHQPLSRRVNVNCALHSGLSCNSS